MRKNQRNRHREVLHSPRCYYKAGLRRCKALSSQVQLLDAQVASTACNVAEATPGCSTNGRMQRIAFDTQLRNSSALSGVGNFPSSSFCESNTNHKIEGSQISQNHMEYSLLYRFGGASSEPPADGVPSG